MTISIDAPNSVRREFKSILKTYPRSKKGIRKKINDLKKNPLQGNPVPGFGDFEVRKLRIGLPEYNISPRKGLRLTFFYKVEESRIILLTIYRKSTYGGEAEVTELMKKNIREALSEPTACKPIDLFDL